MGDTKQLTAYERLDALSDQELIDVTPMKVGLLKLCPSDLWAKQQAFVDLDCLEAFYGGAAAGGKSEAILAAALKYVHVPGYSALILRRDFSRLNLSGGLIPRSKDWMMNKGPIWNGGAKRWTFESGASLSFGHLDHVNDRYRYGSSEYQYIAWDELTEFQEDDYTFLFSRLRKTTDLDVPLRMRSASNPGGIGHDWVQKRFTTKESLDALREGRSGVFWTETGAAFVPAKISDNPSINEEEYRLALSHLDPLTRQRLMNGDWSVREDSLIRPDMVRRYEFRSGSLHPFKKDGTKLGKTVRVPACKRFATIDTAGTSAQKAADDAGKSHSWSVCAIWDYDRRTKFLYLRHIWRRRVEWPQLKEGIRDVLNEWNPTTTIIENAHHGGPLATELKPRRVELINPVIPGMGKSGQVDGAKLERAVAGGLFDKMEKGEFFIPEAGEVEGSGAWLEDFESEIFAWTGRSTQTADQVDVCSYGTYHVKVDSSDWGGVVNSRGRGGSVRW